MMTNEQETGHSAREARPDLSVIILTFNEERNIRHSVECVLGWARAVFVVDSFSKDDTVEIARSHEGVKVYQHAFEDYGKQWNWALENLPIETEWVMKLDADELVPEECKREVAETVTKAPAHVGGFALWRKFILMGKWLKHTVERCYDVRVWRRGRGKFEDCAVNEHLIVTGDVEYLRSPLVHEDRKGISAWVWRHNRYSTMEALAFFRRRQSAPAPSGKSIAFRRFLKEKVWPWVPFKPSAYFMYLYVGRLGFLDGREGLAYARFMGFYFYLIELKKMEYRATGDVSSPDVME
jgi:glycosyltransferase involved in cell wall biosynthesis